MLVGWTRHPGRQIQPITRPGLTGNFYSEAVNITVIIYRPGRPWAAWARQIGAFVAGCKVFGYRTLRLLASRFRYPNLGSGWHRICSVLNYTGRMTYNIRLGETTKIPLIVLSSKFPGLPSHPLAGESGFSWANPAPCWRPARAAGARGWRRRNTPPG